MTPTERALLIAVAETVRRMAANPVAMVQTHDLTAALLNVAIGPHVASGQPAQWHGLTTESDAALLERQRQGAQTTEQEPPMNAISRVVAGAR